VKLRDTDDPIVVVNSCPPESCTTQVPSKCMLGFWVATVTFWERTNTGRTEMSRNSRNMIVQNKICSDYRTEILYSANPDRQNFIRCSVRENCTHDGEVGFGCQRFLVLRVWSGFLGVLIDETNCQSSSLIMYATEISCRVDRSENMMSTIEPNSSFQTSSVSLKRVKALDRAF
jgi:hypothetical protein